MPRFRRKQLGLNPRQRGVRRLAKATVDPEIPGNSWCKKNKQKKETGKILRSSIQSLGHNLYDSSRWLSPDLGSSENLRGAQWDRFSLLYIDVARHAA